MKAFMDKDFLLPTETAQKLYHEYAEVMPVLDYHCHINPQEIYEDRKFENITQVWLGGDHYKWRAMRTNGIDERYCTGKDTTDWEKFEKWAETVPYTMRNPLYHWTHLELKTAFGVEKLLNPSTAREIYDVCTEKLQSPEFYARGLMEHYNVETVCTTDDPVDSLEHHLKVAADGFKVKMLPTWRPDKAMNIHKDGFVEYIGKLAKAVGKKTLATAQDVCDALIDRIYFFHEHGCRASDHGLDYVPFHKCTMEEANAAYQKALRGEKLTVEEIEGYQTVILLTLGKAYHRMDIAMQLHYSCLRNNNQRIFKLQGGDTGVDAIAQNTCGGNISQLLSALDEAGACPKTILYSLNPADNAQLGTLIGCFQGPEVPGKI